MSKFFTYVGIVSLLAGAFYLGSWIQKPTLDDLTKQTRALAMQDSVRQLQLSNTVLAFQRLAFDYSRVQDINLVLRDSASELHSHLMQRDAQILSLISANAELRVRLDTTTVPVEETPEQLLVRITERKDYESGDISLEGSVLIEKQDPTTAQTEFSIFIRTEPSVSISRLPDGTAEVILSFGDMPIEVTELFGAQLVRDPLLDETRGRFFDFSPKINVGTAVVVGMGVVLGAVVF